MICEHFQKRPTARPTEATPLRAGQIKTELCFGTLVRVCFALFMAIGCLNVVNPACSAENPVSTIEPVRTDSPRHTFESFIRLGHQLDLALLDYRVNRTWANRIRVSRIGEEVLSLIDLSAVPEVSRRERGIETGAFLLDILGRIKLPASNESRYQKISITTRPNPRGGTFPIPR